MSWDPFLIFFNVWIVMNSAWTVTEQCVNSKICLMNSKFCSLKRVKAKKKKKKKKKENVRRFRWIQTLTWYNLNQYCTIQYLSLDAKFEKFNVELHFFFLISFMLAIFQVDQRLIAISSIKCVNIKILQFKIMHKSGVYGLNGK